MNPEDRYVIFRAGTPVATASDRVGVIAYLWGRYLRDQYCVFDYERPFPVDNANLTEWLKQFPD